MSQVNNSINSNLSSELLKQMNAKNNAGVEKFFDDGAKVENDSNTDSKANNTLADSIESKIS